jgi:hypothetical protein
MGTVTRDARTPALVEALVVEGVVGSGRAAIAADVIDRVLAEQTPDVYITRRPSRLPEILGYLGLLVAVLGGQLALLDETTDTLGYTLMSLAAIAGFLQYVVVRRAGGYLLIAVAATTLVIPQLTAHLTDGTLGSEGSWLMAGMAFVASALVAWRIHEEHRPTSEKAPRA